MKPEWNILKLLTWTASYFKSHNIDSPRVTAEILLAHTLKLERIDLYLRHDQPLSKSELKKFKDLIKRRIKREPVAYITGIKEFWAIDIGVSKDVLIPRPETECLVEIALSLLPENLNDELNPEAKRILDIGTGSGAIILALASTKPKHIFFASDCSRKALAIASQNAKRHNLNGKINFFVGKWFEPLNNGSLFDIIISNPPYIPTKTIGNLQPEIYKYEPIIALDGGSNGLNCLTHIINNAHLYLKKRGSLLLEIGYDQKNRVSKIIDQCGKYENVVFTKDYSGYYRVVQINKN